MTGEKSPRAARGCLLRRRADDRAVLDLGFFRAGGGPASGARPVYGPVLLCINHPNNLIDSLLVGAVVPRKVHYLATAALFRTRLSARLLAALGVIPVYRKADDPDRTDRNVELFAACHQAFDRGRLIAMYPEGATRAEAHAQRIKTGAARIALGYEARAPGGLAVVPVAAHRPSRSS